MDCEPESKTPRTHGLCSKEMNKEAITFLFRVFCLQNTEIPMNLNEVDVREWNGINFMRVRVSQVRN
jgi:hypothetical protein